MAENIMSPFTKRLTPPVDDGTAQSLTCQKELLSSGLAHSLVPAGRHILRVDSFCLVTRPQQSEEGH